ncbi:hypothetical protein SAMN05443429_10475 [Cruoricaptor ignavus]|uniref:Tetratricopeptide repeat-containing protein n=1 Tax=Cruoricaptor ignavus TaxID=1118202 RepID=A0A1M6DS09_9FLAO|nr:hypothetical protein [Cruoricaptor ignavus]SHI75965.1 hypothetical protein SAMN05443429_10475 [Cruoricaptor ignavus]
MKKIIIASVVLASIITGCRDNPNVTEDVFLTTPNSMSSWIVGVNRQAALTMNSVIINAEITSDNYFNNYSQYTKVFDRLQIEYFDYDVNQLQNQVSALYEMADYGITKVAAADNTTTKANIAYLHLMRGYARILGGELFIALPESPKGKILTSQQLIQKAVDDINNAISLGLGANEAQFANLLLARAYYNLGDKSNAKKMATTVISSNPQMLYTIKYDGQNGVGNEMQNATFEALPNRLAPLPRLDFLDPKYFYKGTAALEQKSIAIGKSEEAYLILAEAYLSENNLSFAKDVLINLINDVVAKRPTAMVNDKKETRNGGNRKDYPLKAVGVKFSADAPVKTGLVLDRQAGDVKVYTVSGTSVTADDVAKADSVESLLYLTYLLRQEIFISEGRRLLDLGIKYPISQIEENNNPNVTAEFTKVQIPEFVPKDLGLDDFSTDASGTVTIKNDMNRIIVNNRKSPFIAPFFK